MCSGNLRNNRLGINLLTAFVSGREGVARLMRKWLHWVFAFYLTIVTTDVCRAEIDIYTADETGTFARIAIQDSLTKADVQRFTELEALLRPMFEILGVELNSPGGDVIAAMQIGEIIRKDWLWTSVSDEPQAEGCLSACVLIFAAGANRILGGDSRVGIHRPRFDPIQFGRFGSG
jgi:hypothetical protein